MLKRQLGKSDLTVSVIGLGCNNFGGRSSETESRSVIDAAIDHGIDFFDTADIYAETRSETLMGQILGSRRAKIILATKFGKPVPGSTESRRATRVYIEKAVEASLKRLNTDYIDLYQHHESEPSTPIEETLGALEDLVKAGKIRYYGASNYTPDQLKSAAAAARSAGYRGFVTSQDEYSLVARDIETSLLPTIESLDLALIPYFPLASGLLSGKYEENRAPEGTRLANSANLSSRYLTDRNLELLKHFKAFAEARGHTVLELAFAWLLAHPSVPSVIAGATKPAQIAANVAAADWVLSAADRDTVSALGKAAFA